MNSLYRQILSEVEKELQIHPDYADLRNQFALHLIIEGEREKAESHFLKALRLNPKYREAILNLGFLYIEKRRWKEAEEIFLAEAKRHPKDSFFHHALGILYLHTGKEKEAAAQIYQTIQCRPYYRSYYQKKGVWRRGVVHLDQKAERTMKKIHLNYPSAQLHNFIGLYLAKKGKSTQAAKELRKAARLEPDESIFHANLGTVYYYRGAFQ